MMKKPGLQFFLMPMLGLVVLAGAGADLMARPKPGDAEPYHAEVRKAAANVPESVGEWDWDQSIKMSETAAIKLLKPNVLIQRSYKEAGTGRQLVLMIDQCPDARNMLGHYPPVCYAGQGLVLLSQTPVTLTAGSAGEGSDGAPMKIDAMEYVFSDKARDSRTVVVNFLILPTGRFVTDMDEVYRAAADFGQRFYGAGQVQMVFQFPANMNEAEVATMRVENRKVVEMFLSANSALLRRIYSGGRR